MPTILISNWAFLSRAFNQQMFMYAAVHPYSEINNQRETNTLTDFFDFGINHCEYKTIKALIHREVNNKFVSAVHSLSSPLILL